MSTCRSGRTPSSDTVTFPRQRPDAGQHAAVDRAEAGAGPGAAQVQEAGGVDAEAGRRDAEDGRAAVPDDSQGGGKPTQERRQPSGYVRGEQELLFGRMPSIV